MIRVTVNGEEVELDAPMSVGELVTRQTGREAPLGVAVARNKDVVPRSAWDEVTVADGDELELVGVMQGG